MKLNDFHKQFGIVQAPLAGISNTPYRLICREYGAGLVFSEMISADGIVQGNPRTARYLMFDPQEHPIAIQIFGSNPRIIARAVEKINPLKPDFIDINMGCPARKVVKKGAGAALLKNLSLAGEIVATMRNTTDIPITAKIRNGWGQYDRVAVELAQLLEEKGIDAITVHPRTQWQLYKEHADWDVIRQVKAAVKIPVIGNGDVDSPQKAKAMLETTGCETVMIGRAAMGYPWIFKQVRTFLESGKDLPRPSFSERLDVCLKHFRLAVHQTAVSSVESMRKHILYYTRGMPQSAQFRNEIVRLLDPDQVEKKIRDYQQFVRTYE